MNEISMALAVTHVILTIILVDLYRDYITKHKKFFTLHTIFIAGVAGLLPDIDIPLNWLFKIFGVSFQHGGITHTPLFGLIFLIPGFYFWYRKNHKVAVYFFVITFGVLFHISLDLLFNEGSYMLLYPLSTKLFQLVNFSFEIIRYRSAIDAIILLAWLYHEEVKHKISDFI